MSERDFLDGIDEQFLRRMKSQGNGKRNGHSFGRSTEDLLITKIVDELQNLSRNQQEQVLAYIESLENHKVG